MEVDPSGPAAIEAARELLGARGIPVPPVPEELRPHLTYYADLVWSTLPDGHGAGDAASVLFGAAKDPPGDYVHFGLGGYGLANQVFTYQLVSGPVLIAVDVRWDDDDASGIADAVADIAALLDAAKGRLAQGKRLVVVVPATERGSWAIVRAERWSDVLKAAAGGEGSDGQEGNPLREARGALVARRARS